VAVTSRERDKCEDECGRALGGEGAHGISEEKFALAGGQFIHRTELCKSRSHARTVQIVAQEHARLLSATPMEIAQSESAVVI
jgi:hypothetical protein